MTATKPAIKEHPILFSAPMVKAILEGRKTQTRRVISPQPIDIKRFGTMVVPYKFGKEVADLPGTRVQLPIACPYGEAGERLWVRETWGSGDGFYNSHEIEPPRVVAYRADLSAIDWGAKPPCPIGRIDIASWNWKCVKWRPSIFMPRWASRISLEIITIKFERLQDISAQDCKAEGVFTDSVCTVQPGQDRATDEAYRNHFCIAWDSINGKRASCDWQSNPWVWVVEFQKATQ